MSKIVTATLRCIDAYMLYQSQVFIKGRESGEMSHACQDISQQGEKYARISQRIRD